MAQDIQEILKDTVDKIKQLVADASTMTVETWYIEIGVDQVPVDSKGRANFRQNAHPVAMSELRFDGDSVAILPMRNEGGVLVVDEQMRVMHERNLRAATEYRTGILNAAVGILKETG